MFFSFIESETMQPTATKPILFEDLYHNERPASVVQYHPLNLFVTKLTFNTSVNICGVKNPIEMYWPKVVLVKSGVFLCF